MRLPLLLAALLVGVAPAAQAADAEPDPGKPTVTLRNRLTVGGIVDLPHHGQAGFELMLSERMRLTITSERLTTTVLIAGRMGIRPQVNTVDRTRIRALGVRLEFDSVRLEIGRSAVIDGGWRLVDGVQALVRPSKLGHFEVGGWVGEMPDIWTTAPAPRFGGGPIVRWRGRNLQLGFVGEIGGGAMGLDRAAARFTGRFEHRKLLDVSARAEIEAGGPGTPVRFSELGIGATLDPLPILRARVGYSMHAGHSWLRGIQRDPSLTRWQQRTNLSPAVPAPWQAATDGPTHQILGSVRLRPTVGDVPLTVAVRARYGHRTVARERNARITLQGGATGLAGGRLDITALGGALLWGGAWRSELGLRTWVAPDNKGVLNIEAEGRFWLGEGPGGKVSPTVAADLWLDVATPIGVSLAAGYRFDNDLDLDRWNAAHTVLFRASWGLRLPR